MCYNGITRIKQNLVAVLPFSSVVRKTEKPCSPRCDKTPNDASKRQLRLTKSQKKLNSFSLYALALKLL